MKKIVLIALVILAIGLVGVSCKDSSATISTPSVDLLTAIDKENISVIKQHIDAGTNINDYPIPKGLPFEGAEPLTLAVLKGNAEIVQLLLDNGADIEIKAKDKNGATPLHYAAFFLHEEMASLLIKSGADVNSINANGVTPLDSAAQIQLTVLKDAQKLEKVIAIIQLLLKNGGNSGADL